VVPTGYVRLIVCDTRRAERWRAAFAGAGIRAVVDDTDADDADRGAQVVAVPRAQLVAANAIVTEVTQGRRRLPGTGAAGVVVIAAIVIAAVVAVAIARGG
jgi:hypothetical protein